MSSKFKRQFCSLLFIITIISFCPETLALSLDSAQVKISQDDFNIVLITIDTLRADHLSCYGYERKTSPNIDSIAKEGIRFTNALATSSWTSPSMASIMTSLYPISHGVRHGFTKSGKAYNQELLHEKFDTLAEVLKNHGYTTFGAVANVHMVEELGFGQGFDYYHCEGFDKASKINNIVFSWKDKIKNANKIFLWVHYFDPHHFYNAQSPWINDYAGELWIGNTHLSKKSMKELKKLIPNFKQKKSTLEYLTALYDSEISYADHHIGKLICKLGLDKNSLIVITSDHGEEFLDHDSLCHAHSLYQELIHVPFIIKLPSSSKELVVDEPVSIIDIMPTILGVAGIVLLNEFKGENLLEQDKLSQQRDYLFSELTKVRTLRTILNNNWKYIYDYKTRKEALYNITEDPGELVNLVHQEASIAKELKEELINWVSTSPKGPSIKMQVKPSKDIEEKLKAMGYISNGEQEELKPPPKDCTSCKPTSYKNQE